MADVPHTTRSGPSQNAPVVSVIIPARNEELSLGGCLRSLVDQGAASSIPGLQILVTPDGLPYEIIVVDDNSTDRTPAIARRFPQVRLVAADPLPAGWTGKCNACATGARQARGSWLLFTDADTIHRLGSISRSVVEAKAHSADLLSYSPEQHVSGFAQRALMPLIFAELAATYKPREVCDPASPVAAANGQFLLISREAYFAVGGHAAICGELLEDVALARSAKRSGRAIRFRYGADIVCTHMYRTFRQMHEGWTKNLALLFPSAERLAIIRAVEFTFSVGAALGAISLAAAGQRPKACASGALSAVVLANLYRRVRKAHFGTLSTLISPLGLPLFSYLLLRSRISHRKGNVAWKGRIYTGSTEPVGPTSPAKTQSPGASNG